MPDITRQPNHRDDGISKLTATLQGKPRIAAVLGALMDQIQKLEDVSFDVFLETWIDTSVGARLDVIGRVVGESRGGLEDDEYRAFIRARIRANLSTGLLAELTRILALVQGDNLPVRSDEYYPAALVLQSLAPMVANPYRVGALLKGAKPAGVSLQLVYPTVDLRDTFMFSNGADSSSLTEYQAFGDGQNEPPVDGGKFAGVFG